MSLRERAYKQIRQQIVSLELPPGATIDETKLQEELELGRTPIREALLRLAQERLVTIIPRRGMFVTDIGITDLRQLFEIRYVMETLAIRLAAQRGTKKHWQKMAEVLNQVPPQDSADENDMMIYIDEACHKLIYEAADNKFLHDTLSTLYALSLRLWYYFLKEIGTMRAAIMEHQAMLNALREGDEHAAEQLMQRHIEAFHEEIQTAMQGQSTSEDQPIH